MSQVTSEPLVDLGNMFDVPEPESPRPIHWASARWLRVVVPLCAVLFGTFASAPALRGPLTSVASVPLTGAARILVNGNTLFVYADTARLSAYDLRHGDLVWSKATGEHSIDVTMQFDHDSLIISSDDVDGGITDTESFAAATGRRQWSSTLTGATLTDDGILVQSIPARSAGAQQRTFEMLDPDGSTRWSVGTSVDCVTDVETDPATNLLIALCPGSSRLSVVRLSDGVAAATRAVALGSVADEGRLPFFDQVRQPQVAVIGGTVLIAHANAPTPTIDAYATTDLASLWTGLPMIEGQDIEECGASLCIYTASQVGTVLDPFSGKKIGTVQPPVSRGPATGTLLATPVHAETSTRDAIPAFANGLATLISPGSIGDVWVQQLHILPDGEPVATPIGLLRNVSGNSCVVLGGYLACVATDVKLSVWRLPEATRKALISADGPESFSLAQRPAVGGHFGHYGFSKQPSSYE